MKKTFLLSALLLLFSITLYAQSWQWAKRGGSTGNWPGNSGTMEQVMEMTADRAGNTYVIGRTNKYGADVDGHSLGTLFGEGCMVVASFDCNGNYRWAKPIGNKGAGWTPKGIGVDTLGGVYIAGFFRSDAFGSAGLFQIGSDTTFGTTRRSLVLIKLDTAGAYKWARLPQSDTVTTYSFAITNSISMDVEPNGTVHMFNMLAPGAYAGGGAVVMSQDLYIMKYNAQGQFLANIKPQLSSIGLNGGLYIRMAYDTRRSRYYFSGVEGTANKVSFNGTPNRKGSHISSYTAAGNLEWFRQNTDSNTVLDGKPSFDSSGNLYIGGQSYPGDTFLGHVFVNPPTTRYYSFPFVVKVDSNGSLKWAKNAYTNGALDGHWATYSQGVVALVGPYAGDFTFDTFRLYTGYNNSTDGFIARFDAQTGAVIGLDSAKSASGYQDVIDHACADAKGNFYVGGKFADQLHFGPHSVSNIGGDSDWFIAKFGRANCNCVAAPLTSFTYTAPANSRTITVTYNGTTADVDSLVWEWGNGQRRVVTANFTTPLQYTYSGMGTFNVCVKAYGACGNHQSCKSVQVAMGIEDIGSTEAAPLTLVPNPANGEVAIGYNTAAAGSIEVYDVLGRKVVSQSIAQGSGTWKLDVSAYVPGVYRVVLRQDGKVVLHQSLSIRH